MKPGGRKVDNYAMAELIHAEARVHEQVRRDHHDDVQALVEAEHARVTLTDRVFAAIGMTMVVTLCDDSIVRGECTRVGDGWCEITNREHTAIPWGSIGAFHHLPMSVHEEQRRYTRWTTYLRTCSTPVLIQVQQAHHRGHIRVVAQDHLELSTGVVIAYSRITCIRRPRV
jgi:hypothetical protein